MQCLQCGKEFTPLRSTAKFCSDNCRKQFSRKDSVSEDSRTKTTPRVSGTPVSVSPEVQSATDDGNRPYRATTKWIPNWKRNGYDNATDGLLKAIGDVLVDVPEATIVLGGRIFTNLKETNITIAKARYCPTHHQVQVGKHYLCGCVV
jgi:hypothetical protein